MTDSSPKLPTEVPIGMMALTGLGGSAMGDQIGDSLAEVLSWFVAVRCQCAPPPEVIKGFHTLCVAIVVGAAFYVHYRFARATAQTKDA